MGTKWLVALLATAPMAGCVAAGEYGSAPGTTNMKLEALGAAERVLGSGASRQLQFRYVDSEGEPGQRPVQFVLEGEPRGAILSPERATANSEGLVEVELQAGRATQFDVVATAPDAAPARIAFEVLHTRFGDVEFTVRHEGRSEVDAVEVALFEHARCSDLQHDVPEPVASERVPTGSWDLFEEVEIGVPLALYGLGVDFRDRVVAQGCTDLTLQGPRRDVPLVVRDARDRVGGTYDLQWTVDATASAPSQPLGALLSLLDRFAFDPAGTVVDTVAEDPDSPRQVRENVEASFARERVKGKLKDALRRVHSDGLLYDVEDFADEVHDGLSELTLQSELRVTQIDPEFGSVAPHELRNVGVPHRGEMLTHPLEGSGDARVGLQDESFTVFEHTFDRPLGRLIEAVLEELLLPTMPSKPRSLARLPHQVYPCRDIERHLDGDSEYWKSLTLDVCTTGRELLASRMEQLLTELKDARPLHLEGRGSLEDTDGDRDRDTLRPGDATLRWSAAPEDYELEGTLEGHRAEDTPSYDHPVRN
jgi:hypothetical protein